MSPAALYFLGGVAALLFSLVPATAAGIALGVVLVLAAVGSRLYRAVREEQQKELLAAALAAQGQAPQAGPPTTMDQS